MDIYAGFGVAVAELPFEGREGWGFPDYLLYVDGKTIGVVEAKPEDWTLKGVEIQSAKYTSQLPKGVPAYRIPLPFAYESTGKVTQLTNYLEPHAASRLVFTFHRPEELLALVNLGENQLRGLLRQMPPLDVTGLWTAQETAIRNLEDSFAHNRPRALVQMTMGSGKTFTAVSLTYRLIKYARAERILFLVDRNNLGKPTLREFRSYVSPYNNMTFTDEFAVQRLTGNTVDTAAKVCITTIQRLYSILKGEPDFEEENEESSLFETASPLIKQPLPVVYNPKLPIGFFDVIVVDECHRSIYNLWRQALEYFDAFIVGLTATPSKHTIGFFDGNLVMEYGHKEAVIDRVNVPYDIYRIRTQVTEQGATLEKETGYYVPIRDRRTRVVRHQELDDDLVYGPTELDRAVISKSQMRLVIETFRDRLFTEIFPGRTEVPKTLVFAKDDSHADDLTGVIRDVFVRGNDFCQKITYRTTGKKPEDILSDFRNAYNPRIAVTVDMVATGTDVRPLECLLFMRTVRSSVYYEQMKGRGSRIVDVDTLRVVTPDAELKDRFVIVDAVGVTEDEHAETQPLDRRPTLPLRKVLEAVAMGIVDPDLVSALAAKLIRLERKLDPITRGDIAAMTGGKSVVDLVGDLLTSIDPDNHIARAAEILELSEGQEPSQEQLDQGQEYLIRDAVRPFHAAKLRRLIVDAQAKADQVIDEVTLDVLTGAGYDQAAMERDRVLVEGFKHFIAENRDEIEALRILYSRPRREGLKFDQIKELAAALERPPLHARPERVWRAFELVEGDRRVAEPGRGDAAAPPGDRKPETRDQKLSASLLDIISVIRHILDPKQPLRPFAETVDDRYGAWLANKAAAGIDFTPVQRTWLDAIKDHIARSLRVDPDDFGLAPLYELGGLGAAHQAFGERLDPILEELNERLAA